MKDGLKLLQLPGRYGYSVTRVGWLKRVSGDEYELHNAVTVVRRGNWKPIGQLAEDGPGNDHNVTKTEIGVEEVHRLLVRRSFPADEKAWAEYSPKPKGWEE